MQDASEVPEAIESSQPAEEAGEEERSPVKAQSTSKLSSKNKPVDARAGSRPLQHSVFVRGLLSETTKQELQARLEAFGRVQACRWTRIPSYPERKGPLGHHVLKQLHAPPCRLVVNPLTGRCKGTAFVEFCSSDAAESAAEASAKGR